MNQAKSGSKRKRVKQAKGKAGKSRAMVSMKQAAEAINGMRTELHAMHTRLTAATAALAILVSRTGTGTPRSVVLSDEEIAVLDANDWAIERERTEDGTGHRFIFKISPRSATPAVNAEVVT